MSTIEMTAGHVHLGSTVCVTDASAGSERTYTIVESYDAQPREGKLSVASPIGGALLGHGVGDQINVHTPKGIRRLVICTIT